MEASCSGRFLDTEHPVFVGNHVLQRRSLPGPLRSSARRQQQSHLEAVFTGTPAGSRFQNQSVNDQSPRQIFCAAAPAVEVVSLGEVADVEGIEGLRVIMNEYKRPMVEYLIKWKVLKACKIFDCKIMGKIIIC